jgi:hypothetical protein
MKWIRRLLLGDASSTLMRVTTIEAIRHGLERPYSEDEISQARAWATQRLREIRAAEIISPDGVDEAQTTGSSTSLPPR